MTETAPTLEKVEITEEMLVELIPPAEQTKYENMPKPIAIAEVLVPYRVVTDSFEDQLPNVVINDINDYRRVEEFASQVVRFGKLIAEDQKAITGDAKAFFRFVDKQFKDVKDRLDLIVRSLKTKMTTYYDAEQKRLNAEAQAAREAAEIAALAAAEQAEQRGEGEKAETILDLATQAPSAPKAIKGIGSSASKRWVGTVVDKRAVLQAILDGHVPMDVIKEFSQTDLNAFARNTEKEGTIYGIEIEHKTSMSIR